MRWEKGSRRVEIEREGRLLLFVYRVLTPFAALLSLPCSVHLSLALCFLSPLPLASPFLLPLSPESGEEEGAELWGGPEGWWS